MVGVGYSRTQALKSADYCEILSLEKSIESTVLWLGKRGGRRLRANRLAPLSFLVEINASLGSLLASFSTGSNNNKWTGT